MSPHGAPASGRARAGTPRRPPAGAGAGAGAAARNRAAPRAWNCYSAGSSCTQARGAARDLIERRPGRVRARAGSGAAERRA